MYTFEKVEELKENVRNAINQFHIDSTDSNFFQSTSYFDLCFQTPKLKPIFYIIYENKILVGTLLVICQYQSDVSLIKQFTARNIISGGPIVKNNANNYLNELMRFYVKNKPFAIYTQIRNFVNTNQAKQDFIKLGFTFSEHLNFLVDCQNIEEVNKRISKSKKRQIKQTLKNGCELKEAKSIIDVEQFYVLLSDFYKNKVKLPLPHFNFFKSFFDLNLGKYFLVVKNNQIIGGIMCPIYMKKAIYELYICGLDGQFEGVYPSVLATWAPIEFASDNGIHYFDFLGAGKPDQAYGVREFKSKFGGELVNNGRYELYHSKILYGLISTAFKLLQKVK